MKFTRIDPCRSLQPCRTSYGGCLGVGCCYGPGVWESLKKSADSEPMITMAMRDVDGCQSYETARNRLAPNLTPSSPRSWSCPPIYQRPSARAGFRLATSVGGVLTGRSADFIIIDGPLKPDEALSETQRTAVNQWYDHTFYSRINDKRTGCVIICVPVLGHSDRNGLPLQTRKIESWMSDVSVTC